MFVESFEGPAYADRVGGKLTFHDWERWTEEDQDKYADELMKSAVSKFMTDRDIAEGIWF